jgi:fumarate hydratase class II
MMPLMAHSLLQSFGLLVAYLPDFTARCVAGIEADADRCALYSAGSTPTLRRNGIAAATRSSS